MCVCVQHYEFCKRLHGSLESSLHQSGLFWFGLMYVWLGTWLFLLECNSRTWWHSAQGALARNYFNFLHELNVEMLVFYVSSTTKLPTTNRPEFRMHKSKIGSLGVRKTVTSGRLAALHITAQKLLVSWVCGVLQDVVEGWQDTPMVIGTYSIWKYRFCSKVRLQNINRQSLAKCWFSYTHNHELRVLHNSQKLFSQFFVHL